MNLSRPILVTGGAGFIGSNFILRSLRETAVPIVNVDLLTYAGNTANLVSCEGDHRYQLVRGDICDASLIESMFQQFQPSAVLHFAAESHVDRSIATPDSFIRTNIQGTFTLLEQARRYWTNLPAEAKQSFRFLHVSTDEVFGSLGQNDPAFSETTPYAPKSPYAASKAASDHLVRSYFHTYHLPAITTNCSNNYGPFQYPEKLIPLMILNALAGQPLPVYGDGNNIRDWLFVEDHCAALQSVLLRGIPGETYNIGGNSERTNLQVVHAICDILDELRPVADLPSRQRLITFIPDRPGHDRRYAMNSNRICKELGWAPTVSFEQGLRRTVAWYLDNVSWIERIKTGAYLDWIRLNYDERILL